MSNTILTSFLSPSLREGQGWFVKYDPNLFPYSLPLGGPGVGYPFGRAGVGISYFLNRSIASIGSEALNTKLPLTNTSAPLAINRGAVSACTPPSTSIRA